MSSDKINISSYKVWHRNGNSMSEKQMLDYLLSLDDRLKNTYEMYQDILYAVKEKNKELFMQCINNDYENISK